MVAAVAGRNAAGATVGEAVPLLGAGAIGQQAAPRIARADAPLEVEAGAADAAIAAAIAVDAVAIIADLGTVEDAVAADVGLARHAGAGGTTDGAGGRAVATLLGHRVAVVAAIHASLHHTIATGGNRAGRGATVGGNRIAVVAGLAGLKRVVAAAGRHAGPGEQAVTRVAAGRRADGVVVARPALRCSGRVGDGTGARVARAGASLHMVGRSAGRRRAGAKGAPRPGLEGYRGVGERAALGVAGADTALHMVACAAEAAVGAAIVVDRVAIVTNLGGVYNAIAASVGLARSAGAGTRADGAGGRA